MFLKALLLCVSYLFSLLQADIVYINPTELATVVPALQCEAKMLNVRASWPNELCRRVITQEAFTKELYADELALRYCILHEDVMLIVICSHETSISAEVLGMMAGENTSVLYVKSVSLGRYGWSNMQRLFDCVWYGNLFPVPRDLVMHVGLLKYNHEKIDQICVAKSGQAKSCALTFVTVPDRVLLLAQTCFNNNSLHYLKNACQAQFKQFNDLIVKFKMFLHDGAMNSSCFCIDTSAVLAAYGIRDCHDFDFIHHGYDYLVTQCPNGSELNSHNKGSLRYHSTKKDELIFNPSYYFYYQGIKFLTLHEVVAMKKKRNSKKDKNDIKLVDDFFKNQAGKIFSDDKQTHTVQ